MFSRLASLQAVAVLGLLQILCVFTIGVRVVLAAQETATSSIGERQTDSADLNPEEISVHPTTWSIGYRDSVDGSLFVATSSKYFNVVHRVARLRAGVGLVISQCRGNPDYFEALDLLELGLDPKRALNRLRSEDQRQFNKLSRSRQVAVIDSQGKIDSFTGEDCGRYAGQIVNKQLGYVLLGNGLESQEVLIAMDKEMRRQELGSFERIALAMQAGLRAGGEVRPESSAGLCYASGTSSSKWWKDSGECLSIEDSDTPVMDLIKLFNLEQSRLALEKGFESFEGGDFDSGSDAFEIAKRLNPTDMEIPLWQGFFLYKSGRKAKGLKILRPIIESNDPWPKETLRRFGGSVGDELLEKMLSAEKK